MLLLALACLSQPAGTPAASAVDPGQLNKSTLQAVDPTPREVPALIGALASEQTSAQALDALVAIGEPAIDALEQEALHGDDITARGWSIQALARIDSEQAEQALTRIHDRSADTPLVRNWAAAGLFQQADDLDELMALAPLQQEHPSLARPFQNAARAMGDTLTDLRAAIVLLQSDPSMGPVVGDLLAKAEVSDLARVMFTDADNNVRRTAAGLLAARPDDAREIARQYAFVPGSEQVLWQGGALYVPNVGWQKKEARILVGNLVSWFVFCEEQGLDTEKQQIFNNLNSLGLINTVGMAWPGYDAHEVLVNYGKATNVESARRILAEQGLLDDPRWSADLERI